MIVAACAVQDPPCNSRGLPGAPVMQFAEFVEANTSAMATEAIVNVCDQQGWKCFRCAKPIALVSTLLYKVKPGKRRGGKRGRMPTANQPIKALKKREREEKARARAAKHPGQMKFRADGA